MIQFEQADILIRTHKKTENPKNTVKREPDAHI